MALPITSLQRRQFLGAAATAALLAGCDAPRVLAGGFTGMDMASGHQLRARLKSGNSAHAQRAAAHAGADCRWRRAGLAAARALRLAGVDDFALLEIEDQPGGNSRGGQVGGIACPLGAHYLPLPGQDALEVQDVLEELGLRQRVAGRWQYGGDGERHLCHSPQERLYWRGEGTPACCRCTASARPRWRNTSVLLPWSMRCGAAPALPCPFSRNTGQIGR